MKKVFLAVFALLCSGIVNAQDFIQTVDGRKFWADINPKEFAGMDFITVEKESRMYRIPKSDIVLIEFINDGLFILQEDKLKKVEPVAYSGDFPSFIAANKKVYVPLASKTIQQRSGAKKLRELLMADKHWEIVGCEQEADFLLLYVFDDSGADHAYLEVRDRRDVKIQRTRQVRASDFIPMHAGEESAEKLYKKFLVESLYENKTTGWFEEK
jgi:hypothetical protein